MIKTTIKPKVDKHCSLFWADISFHITAYYIHIGLRGNPKWPPKMMKNNVFDKSGYKKNVNSILWPIMDGYLTPTMYFDIVIYITASMKTLGLPGNPKWPPKLPKIMFLIQNHYIINNNWKLRDFLAWYLSPTVNFDNIAPLSACIKIIGLGENHDATP